VPIVEHLPDCIGLAFYLSESRIAALRIGIQLSTLGVIVKFFSNPAVFFVSAERMLEPWFWSTGSPSRPGLKKVLQILGLAL